MKRKDFAANLQFAKIASNFDKNGHNSLAIYSFDTIVCTKDVFEYALWHGCKEKRKKILQMGLEPITFRLEGERHSH
jgi:hypothetical protein